MAKKRIVWAKEAKADFKATLQFYTERNGSSDYSRKLADEILALIDKLPANNFLGRETSAHNVRLLVKGMYSIFYELKENEIVILMVWDGRRNPDELADYIK